jgi:hypothetical protein
VGPHKPRPRNKPQGTLVLLLFSNPAGNSSRRRKEKRKDKERKKTKVVGRETKQRGKQTNKKMWVATYDNAHTQTHIHKRGDITRSFSYRMHTGHDEVVTYDVWRRKENMKKRESAFASANARIES